MEIHAKGHANVQFFICDICEKDFYSNRRLNKHVNGHSEMGKYCHYFNNGKKCPYYDLGCKFKHEESENCKYDKFSTFNLCQFKHTNSSERLEEIGKESEDNHVGETDVESDDDMDDSEDDSLTDNEAIDYEKVTKNELKQSQYDDCNGCSKILSINNSYKCKKCGVISHRSNCNTWFDTVKKHHYCGGCAYDFKPRE